MSRIRSQLEAIRRNSAQSGYPSGGGRPTDEGYPDQPQYAPQPVHRAAPVAEPMRNDYRQPQQGPQYAPMGGGEIDRIRERLDQITGAIGSLARLQSQPAPQHPQYQARPAAPADDRNTVSALARLELLQREMVDIKSLVTQIAGRDPGQELALDMRRIADGVARLQEAPQSAPNDHMAHLEEVAGELHQIREAILGLAQERNEFDPALIARSMEDGYARIAGRLDTLERHAQAANQPDPAQHEAFAALSTQISGMRGLVEQLPVQLPIDALSARLDEISAAVAHLDGDQSQSRNFRAMEERLDEITRALVALSVNPVSSDDGLERVEARLASLARNVEELAAQRNAAPADGGYASPVLDHIMMQLGDLSARMEAGLPSAGLDPAQWVDPVLSRLEEMGARLDNLQSAPASGDADMLRLRSLEDQIAAIAYHIEQVPAQQPVAGNIADERLVSLEQTLGAIAARLETVSSNGVDFSPIASRLDNIEQQFLAAREMASDAAAQAAERAVQLYGRIHQEEATGEPMANPLDLGSITQKLESLEQQIAISRDMAMDAVAQAAERAVQMAGEIPGRDGLRESPTAEPQPAADPYLVEQLSREMQNLEAQAREFSHRNEDSFESIRQALSTISDRLLGIEDDIRRATAEPEPVQQEAPRLERPQLPQTAYASQPAYEPHGGDARPLSAMDAPYVPELALANDDSWSQIAAGDYPLAPTMALERNEPEIEDVPLEPGSGVPDLAALVRDASKRRRASAEADGAGGTQDFLAAARRAAQAAALDAANATATQDTASAKPKLSLRLNAFLQNRRKLLMGASAAIILIAVGLPVVSFLSGGQETQPAEIAGNVTRAEPQEPASSEPAADSAETAQSASSQDDAQVQVRPVDPLEESLDQESGADRAIAQDPGTASADAQMSATDSDAGVELPAIPAEIGNTALRQAAEAGDPLALFEIARRYTDGDGVERSLETAALWYEASARAGSAPAQYRLANFLEKGHGVKLDVEKSALWYQRAAEQGNALAMHNLAVIHTSGLVGGKPDMESAIGWFLKAADLGVKDSQVNLGIIFAKGIGAQPDVEQAYKWLAIAARGGDTDAASKRDTLAAAMRPEQLEKARGEAELWKPQTLDSAANVAVPRPEWKSAGESAMLPGSSMDTATDAVTKDLIAKVQAQLAQMGYDPGPADGQMGERTVEAVKAFQKKSGLPVDGQITGELLKKLDPAA